MRIAYFSFATFALGCVPTPGPIGPSPDADAHAWVAPTLQDASSDTLAPLAGPDGGSVDAQVDPRAQDARAPVTACERAEAKLVQLGCKRSNGVPWAQTPQGARFSDACANALANGRNWHPEKIAQISSCDKLDCVYKGTCP